MRGSSALLASAALRRAWARPARRLATKDAPPWKDGRVAAVCGSTLTMMTGHGVATPCVPLLATTLGAGAADVGAALSTFGLARLALNVPVGLAADSVGRKPLLVGGALLNAAGHAASALAPDATSFAAARFVAGAGSAAYLGTAQVYLSDVAKPSQRGRVLGLNHAALLVGVSVGPVLGGFGAELSVRAPFYAVAGLGLLSAVHAFRALEETKPATTPQKDGAKGDGPAPRRPGRRAVRVGRASARDDLRAAPGRPEPVARARREPDLRVHATAARATLRRHGHGGSAGRRPRVVARGQDRINGMWSVGRSSVRRPPF